MIIGVAIIALAVGLVAWLLVPWWAAWLAGLAAAMAACRRHARLRAAEGGA